MNLTKTLVLNADQINDLKRQYKQSIINSSNQNIDVQFKLSDCTITVYHSLKVVFQGKEAEIIASHYASYPLSEQAGSDEVGTGDYFGPVVVVACAIKEKDIPLLKDLKLLDSKVLDDQEIRKMAKIAEKIVPYSVLVVDNLTYNKIHKQHNLNAIKAKLHNQAYLHLSTKTQMPSLAVVDQFAPEALYYRYLSQEKEIFRSLHFETKAESKYPAVALASILARAKFLQVMDQLNEHYAFTFPLGSGEKVDQAAKQFVERYGQEKLNEVAKVHFKNTQRIIKAI